MGEVSGVDGINESGEEECGIGCSTDGDGAEQSEFAGLKSAFFGDLFDWTSPLSETYLYVELPYWLMMPPGPVDVLWSGIMFRVDVCSPWMEVFVREVSDSRVTCLHNGPLVPDGYHPPPEIAEELARLGLSCMTRCGATPRSA
jgi:hypothetical protein